MRLDEYHIVTSGYDTSLYPHWKEVENSDATWRLAIHHTLRGNVAELAAILDAGLDVEMVFSLNLQRSVEQNISLAELEARETCKKYSMWDSRNESAITLLHAAAKRNQVAVIELLLKYEVEADVIARPDLSSGDEPTTALYEAAIRGHYEAAECLLNAGAIPTGSGYNWTDILSACLLGLHIHDPSHPVPDNPDVRGRLLVLLLERGADPEMKIKSSQTVPILTAMKCHRFDLVKELHRRGASCGQTLRTAIIADGSEELLDFLLQSGADDVSDSVFQLSFRIKSPNAGQLSLMSRILDRRPKFMDSEAAREGLCDGARVGSLSLVQLLLDKGLSIDSNDGSGLTPLMQVIRNESFSERLNVVEWLISNGADVNRRAEPFQVAEGVNRALHESYTGATALHFAMSSWHEKMVRLLLAAGADINPRCQTGETPLLRLCRTGGVKHPESQIEIGDLIDELVFHGAKIDDVDNQQKTVLHLLAIGQRDIDERALAAEAFLVRGANAALKDNTGRMALQYTVRSAREERNYRLFSLLWRRCSEYQRVLQSMSDRLEI